MTQPERDEARDAAIIGLITTLVSLALQVGIMLALANRDTISRVVIRYRWQMTRPWRKAEEERLVAELRKELSDWEHDNAG